MISYSFACENKEIFSNEILKSYLSDLPQYAEAIKKQNFGFTQLHLQDTAPIKKVVDQFSPHIDYICILGIGGSMLGTQFLMSAFEDKNKSKEFIFLDNIDPSTIQATRRQLPLQRTLFLVQSKSGSTPETIAQYAYFLNEIITQGLEPSEHFVFVTDPGKGFLREEADKRKIAALDIPPTVGGRFSVLTPVGLLSAAFAGINIDELLQGSKDIVDQQLFNPTDASAYTYACFLFNSYQNKMPLHILMPYSDKLKLFSNWAVQLISESSGKEADRDGNLIHWGITPIPALGVTDQHSQLQLFVQGPKDKSILFIEVKEHPALQIDSANSVTQDQRLDFFKNKTFSQLMKAELEGTKQSLLESGLPISSLTLEKINEKNIGRLIQFFQLAIAYLGELSNVDMFNQPGVERSKQLAKINLQQET